jgi:hypothetical protein
MNDQAKQQTQPMTEDEFRALLVSKGLLRSARPKKREPRVRQPIIVEGRPVSELVIEERR